MIFGRCSGPDLVIEGILLDAGGFIPVTIPIEGSSMFGGRSKGDLSLFSDTTLATSPAGDWFAGEAEA